MELAILSKTTTMTSREIAELVGSTHDNVLKTVRRLISEGVVFGNDTPYTHPQNGQTYTEFKLDFRNTMVVASGYSAELRARIIDRWQELEAQVAPAPAPAPQNSVSAVVQVLADSLSIADLLGVPLHLAQTEAVKETLRLTGRDFSNMLRLAPAQSNIARLEEALEPTELGKSLGLSAIKLNQTLCAAGLQVKALDGWEPTAKGAPYAIRHHWAKGDKSGYNWKWKTSVLELLKDSK